MDWRAESAALLEHVHRAAEGSVFAIAASCTSLVLLLAFVTLAARHRRLHKELAALAPGAERLAATPPPDPDDALAPAPIDCVLPRRTVSFYALVLGLLLGCWLLGLALAPSMPRFLQSLEWHIQPFFLAAHVTALRLFVRLFERKYVAGAAELDMPVGRLRHDIRRILGLQGGLLAVAIAVPFCLLDYRYLVSDSYEKLGADQTLHAIDYVMWAIWCVEWLINAFIWVTLVGFLVLSYRALRTYRFRAPIAVVVQEQRYRPFLQLSSQGATIVLGFACVTAFYIWYAGGAVSDFLGLGITGLLLVVGFVPLWLLLSAKVKGSIRNEIEALRRNWPAPLENEARDGAPERRSVEERLDEVVALMRAWQLERLQLDLGRSEAQALAVRLAAPAATAGWQLYSNLQGVMGKLVQGLGSILSALAKLFT